jgi:hypothetical protein
VKHCNGVTYYLRSDLGLRRGKWHAAREPQRRPFSMRRAAGAGPAKSWRLSPGGRVHPPSQPSYLAGCC